MRRTKNQQYYQPQGYYRQAKTPDPRIKNQDQRDCSVPEDGKQEQYIDPSILFLSPCKFWKSGKCDWGWSCRFLHGVATNDDPRRPEYRGQPVDFTKFPRPISASSPYLNSNQQSMSAALNTIRAEDQSRFKLLRNPVVDIVSSSPALNSQVQSCKDLFLKNNINILYSDSSKYYNLNKTKEQFELDDSNSDYVLFIDISGTYLLLPDHKTDPIPCTLSNICETILNDWDMRNNNFTLEQLELLSSSELEQILLKLTPHVLDNIEENVQNLQNETSDAIASMTTASCKFTKEDIKSLRSKMLSFFGKLNLANFMIADLPIYANKEPKHGQNVQFRLPKPGGLSQPTQKVMLYIIGTALTRIHVCISHLNKILGEYKQNKTAYAQITPNAPCLHQSSLCSPNCSMICAVPGDVDKFNRFEYNRHLEPEVAVDMPTQYSLSFRSRGFNDGFYPRNQPF